MRNAVGAFGNSDSQGFERSVKESHERDHSRKKRKQTRKKLRTLCQFRWFGSRDIELFHLGGLYLRGSQAKSGIFAQIAAFISAISTKQTSGLLTNSIYEYRVYQAGEIAF
jgi:hypothetical protein